MRTNFILQAIIAFVVVAIGFRMLADPRIWADGFDAGVSVSTLIVLAVWLYLSKPSEVSRTRR